MTYKIFIDGAVGTTGLKVADRLATHKGLEALCLEDDLRKDSNARRDMMAAADLAVLCLPDDAARESAAIAAEVGTRVIDASSAHRTADGWAYGFAELAKGQRDQIANAMRISNPGCYPTGFLALVRPLMDAGVLSPDALLTVPAISGFSGGGKATITRQADGELPVHSAYGVTFAHKHIPEMTQYTGLKAAPIFMPSIGDFYAGMLVHVPLHAAQLKKAASAQDLYDIIAAHYEGAALVRMGGCAANDADALTQTGLLAADGLVGANHMELFVFGDQSDNQFWLTARLDNLGKGASGAAVQNMNIALGMSETEGLV